MFSLSLCERGVHPMKSLSLTLAATLLLLASGHAQPPAPAPLAESLHSAIARTAYEEYVAEVLATAEAQASRLAAAEKNVTTLGAQQATDELAFLESLNLTRVQLSQSRRAVLACSLLTRDEAELLLGALAATTRRWDALLAEEVPARKAALRRQLEIAAVAVMAPSAPSAPPPARTPSEVLAAASRRLRPMGTALIGNEYHLLLDGQRMRAGQTIKVTLDRDHVVTLAVVSKNSFTLAYAGESLVVPMD